MKPTRLLARLTVPSAVLAGALVLAGPAFAHVQVDGQPAQALAGNAVVGFSAEGESTTAGINQVRVVLPTGLRPSDITLADAPKGWELAATDDGFTVAGPALAPGKSADYKVKVRQLPDAKELVFKSLVTYTDGHLDRWIELPQPGTKPGHPAPVLKLTAASPGATPLPAVSSAAPSASASGAAPSSAAPTPSPAASTTPAAATSDDGSSGSGPVVIGLVAALVVLIAGVVLWRRRAAADAAD